MTEDLTQVELEIIHEVFDAQALTQEESDQLEEEAGRGGGPLTDELTAEAERAIRSRRSAD